MSWHERLEELGIVLPEQPTKLGVYEPGVLVEDLLFVSGQTPHANGAVTVSGLVGVDVSVKRAAEGARLAVLNALAQARALLGGLDRIVRVVRITGYVASGHSFVDHPSVINGASETLIEIFGDAGRHARSAIGVSSLPQGASVELDLILQVSPVGG